MDFLYFSQGTNGCQDFLNLPDKRKFQKNRFATQM